jgi:glycosyltransferase involved in cell wall biosynthesis
MLTVSRSRAQESVADATDVVNALFAHDHRFYTGDGAIWTESQFESDLWSRYLQHFDALTVVARRGEPSSGRAVSSLHLSSAPRVDFEFLPDLSSLAGLLMARSAARRRLSVLVQRHDAVIARLPSEIGSLAVKVGRSLGKPVAIEAVGCPWDGLWNYGSLTGKAYAPYAAWQMRRALRHCDHAIYVTREFLQRRYPTSASNCCAVSDVELAPVNEDVLNRRLARIDDLPRSPRPLKLGLIGTLKGRFKGIDTLLRAVSKQREGSRGCSVHILGPGDPSQWIALAHRLGIAERVSFDGTLPPGEPVRTWLDSIDLYLQPSLKEGLPRALIEAMSRGCPVIASNVAGIPELLPEQDMVVPGSASGLESLLRRRVDDVAWMRDRARRNWEASRGFERTSLEARRLKFWGQFRDQVLECREEDSIP